MSCDHQRDGVVVMCDAEGCLLSITVVASTFGYARLVASKSRWTHRVVSRTATGGAARSLDLCPGHGDLENSDVPDRVSPQWMRHGARKRAAAGARPRARRAP